MINALSIDLEDWHNTFLGNYTTKREDQINESTTLILNLLDTYDTKATFFVLGVVADKYPELIETIYERGHEIASHAYSHTAIYDLDKVKFEDEIKRSVTVLKSATKENPIGFRAPTFSIDNSTKWAFEILKKHGFKYDSSIFSIKTRFYGVPDAPLHPYRPSMEDITKEEPNGGIIEFPLTILKFGVNIPIAGGFYLRFLPFWFLKLAIKKVNKTRPAIIYIHPWEIYNKTPRIKEAPFSYKFMIYHGIDSVQRKLEGLLKSCKFKPVREVLQL